MTDEQALRLERKIDALQDQQEVLQRQMSLFLRAIALKQKEACKLAGVDEDTPRNKFLAGDIEILGIDGSRFNYLTLDTVGELKKRTRPKR